MIFAAIAAAADEAAAGLSIGNMPSLRRNCSRVAQQLEDVICTADLVIIGSQSSEVKRCPH